MFDSITLWKRRDGGGFPAIIMLVSSRLSRRPQRRDNRNLLEVVANRGSCHNENHGAIDSNRSLSLALVHTNLREPIANLDIVMQRGEIVDDTSKTSL